MSNNLSLSEKVVVAACALVVREDNMVLVIHDFRRGTGLPGGTIDTGESPLTCAIRELKEETGLEATATLTEPIYDGITDTGKRAQVFLVTAWKGDLVSSHEGEVYWANQRELISAKAAYPLYNGEVLKRFRHTQ